MNKTEKQYRENFAKQFWEETQDNRNTDRQNFIMAHIMVELEHEELCAFADPLVTLDKSWLMDLLWEWVEKHKTNI